jgi:hypothetical protein
MKTWKQLMVMAFIAIIGIVVVCTTCDNGSEHTHEWEWKVTTPATADAAGLETETCKGCEEARDTRPIPILQIVQADTTIDLSFGTNCKVTVKSTEQFSNPEWEKLVGKVEAAVMRGYNKTGINVVLNENVFKAIFADSNDILIVLSSFATFNCEVKKDDYGTIYLKISALEMLDLQPALWVISDKGEYGDDFYQN